MLFFKFILFQNLCHSEGGTLSPDSLLCRLARFKKKKNLFKILLFQNSCYIEGGTLLSFFHQLFILLTFWGESSVKIV